MTRVSMVDKKCQNYFDGGLVLVVLIVFIGCQYVFFLNVTVCWQSN